MKLNKQAYKDTDSQTDRETDRDRQTDRQTDRKPKAEMLNTGRAEIAKVEI